MGKKIDLTNQVFGKLTVIKEAPKIDNKSRWICQCECGETKIIRGDALRSGLTKSCGCLVKEKAKIQIGKNRKQIQNLIGKKFGNLLVKELVINEEKHSTWLCQCDCGNITYSDSYSLTSGKKKSCGCLKNNNLIGTYYGKLYVLEDSGQRTSNREIIWKCKCSCGNIVYVNTTNLRTGHTQSCGCFKGSKGENKIKEILIKNQIPFEQQYHNDNCKFPDTNYYAYFDFYVNNNYIIEFDGEQHFSPQCFNNIDKEKSIIQFIKTKEHDKIKNEWCQNNNIPLIRIPYTHLDLICLEDLQLETTKFLYGGK